jgi:hypothetical protein
MPTMRNREGQSWIFEGDAEDGFTKRRSSFSDTS